MTTLCKCVKSQLLEIKSLESSFAVIEFEFDSNVIIVAGVHVVPLTKSEKMYMFQEPVRCEQVFVVSELSSIVVNNFDAKKSTCLKATMHVHRH